MSEYRKIDFCQMGEWPGPWSLLVLEATGSHWVNWTLYEIASVGNHPLFQERGAPSSPKVVDLGPDPSPEALKEKAEVRASGYFKWDGCAEIHDLDIHICSRRQWEGLVEILDTLPALCREHFLVPRPGEGGW